MLLLGVMHIQSSAYQQVLWAFHLTHSSCKKKQNPIIISKTSSFTGKKNLDLRISLKHIPIGTRGQISSMHKLQNNGEKNHKNT